MDRRKLHKVNGQTIGKNRQIVSRTRANNRAAHQDANREIEPEEVPVKLSRVERLKLWRLQRDEQKKVDEQTKKKPFVSVVKRGVFLDKTNYTELNKQRRKKLGRQNVSAGQNIPAQIQNKATPSGNNVSRRGRGFVTETEVAAKDNHIENAGLLSIPDDSSALNRTFETQTSETAVIAVENTNDSIPSAGVNSIGTLAADANTLTVPDVSSQLNTTFEMENSVPENTSVLNTTFEMQNSVEQNGGSEPRNQSSMEASSMLSAHAESKNTTEEGHPSINFTLKSSKLESMSEGRRPSIKSTPKYVKPENIAEGERSAIESTPKSVLSTSLNYVSPFVTISRGKGSAHKEVKVRESFYKLELSQSEHDSPVVRQNRAAADYFRGQVNSETKNLMQKVQYWNEYKTENDRVDSVYLDQMDVAIGQTRLLISKKFKQFLGLCDECEKGTSQPPVLPKDLEGFWSMVYMQVEHCGSRFEKLATLKENDWVEVDLLPTNVVTKQTRNRKAAKKGVAASSGIQKMIEEARLKMKESKITTAATSSSTTDVGNGFSMKLRQTPARLSLSAVKTPRSIIKVKTPGVKRSTKSVAFSFIESPNTSSKSAATPKPRVIKRRASTSGVPTENKSMTTDGVSAFLTPNNRKVSTAPVATSTDRRSSRRLFSNVEK